MQSREIYQILEGDPAPYRSVNELFIGVLTNCPKCLRKSGLRANIEKRGSELSCTFHCMACYHKVNPSKQLLKNNLTISPDNLHNFSDPVLAKIKWHFIEQLPYITLGLSEPGCPECLRNIGYIVYGQVHQGEVLAIACFACHSPVWLSGVSNSQAPDIFPKLLSDTGLRPGC